MGLNSYVETPTLGTFTLEDLVTTDQLNSAGVLGLEQPNAPTAIIETDMRSAGPHDTSLSEKELEAIPTWDNKIRILKEHADKIVDMKDIQKDIENTGTINQDRTDVIEATFESFYTNINSRNKYTNFDSITNLSYTKTFMDRKIRVSMEALMTEYEDIDTNAASEMAKDLLENREFCIHELRDTINKGIEDIQAVCRQLCQGPVILPFQDDQFIDMTCVDLSEVDIDKLKSGVPVTQEFIEAFGRMSAIWKSNTFLRNFVEGLMTLYKETHPDCQTPDIYSGLYLATILTAFGEWTSDKMYDEYVTSTDTKAEKIQELQADLSNELKQGSVDAAYVISQKGGELMKLATEAAEAKGQSRELGEFIKTCSIVAVGLSALR